MGAFLVTKYYVCDPRHSCISVHSHNEFLLAILTRCQILVSAPGKGAAPLAGPRAAKPRALGFSFL